MQRSEPPRRGHRRDRGQCPGGTLPPGGAGDGGTRQHLRAGTLRSDRSDRLRGGAQPLGPVARAGSLERGLGRGGGRRGGAARPRQRRRGLHPHARCLLRAGRPQAVARPQPPRSAHLRRRRAPGGRSPRDVTERARQCGRAGRLLGTGGRRLRAPGASAASLPRGGLPRARGPAHRALHPHQRGERARSHLRGGGALGRRSVREPRARGRRGHARCGVPGHHRRVHGLLRPVRGVVGRGDGPGPPAGAPGPTPSKRPRSRPTRWAGA